MPLNPATAAEFADAVRSYPRVLAIGARTKPRLSKVPGDVTLISTKSLTGIIEYEPSEFTFTALAGTPVSEVATVLTAQGQYLPFDPPLSNAGATLGGTVAAGLSGPGRFRYGGLRDFIIGVRFVDGAGRLMRMGGKVVKNAAGFDLPKFFVGSLGRFGALAELTFKVFPCPAATQTLKLPVENLDDAIKIFIESARARWELDALDYASAESAVFMRLRAPENALDPLINEILTRWSGEPLSSDEATGFWERTAEFAWAEKFPILARIITTPVGINAFAETACHITAGGNVAYVGTQSPDQIPLGNGVILRGENAPLWLGRPPNSPILERVKSVLDPDQRFPDL